jgi:hypothetical protein
LEKATPNRVVMQGKRALCAALDIETCLVETKPHIDDVIHHQIFVAMLVPVQSLKLLDFTQRPAEHKSPALDMTFNAFASSAESVG